MKKTARLLFCSLLLLLTPVFASAKMDEIRNSTPEQRAQMQTKWMESNLSLDSAASASVSAINLKYARETQALISSDTPKFQKLMTFRKNSEAKDGELKSLFTPEQYSLYQQKKSEMEAQLKQKIMEKHQAAQ